MTWCKNSCHNSKRHRSTSTPVEIDSTFGPWSSVCKIDVHSTEKVNPSVNPVQSTEKVSPSVNTVQITEKVSPPVNPVQSTENVSPPVNTAQSTEKPLTNDTSSLDEILESTKDITCFILNLGGQTTKVLDKGSIELLGPYGLEKGLLRLSKSLSSLDTGVITSYALFILIGLIWYILIPYISLKEISILLCIMSGLLSIAVNMFSLGISNNKQSHLSVSLLIQSDLFKSFIGKLNFNCMLRDTFPLLISITIGVGLYLAYRFPMYFMLGQLDLLIYYPLFNLMIALCSIIIMASLKGKETKPIQLYLAIFFTFFAMLLFWFGSGYYRELYASLFVFFTNLPFIWESLKDNTMTMPYGGSTTCYKTTPSGLSSGGGGGSSAGIGSTGSGSSAGAGAGAGVSSTGSSASGTGGGSGTGDASSTNILNAKALIERSSQLDKDLADDAFVLKGNIQQEAVKEIAKKFPRIDSRDVPSSVLPYLSFYNLKCRALQEHMVIEACGVKLENSTTKPELALAWRQAKLASISEECSDTMNKYYNTLPRSPRRFIDRTFKNKPW